MTDLTKNIWFAMFLTEFVMMFIINAFALVTLKCDIYLNGLLFHSEVVFTFFFDMKLSFFLVVGEDSIEVSDMLTYFIVHFYSEKID